MQRKSCGHFCGDFRAVLRRIDDLGSVECLSQLTESEICDNVAFLLYYLLTYGHSILSHSMPHLPQNGIPSGAHWPVSHVRRAGPSNSKPRSHVYVATVPSPRLSLENVTELWAGEPGKLHDCAAGFRKEINRKCVNQNHHQRICCVTCVCV